MTGATRILASAAVGSLLVVGTATVAQAQGAARPFASPVTRQTSSAPGSISGVVQDERGVALANVVVSLLGAVTTVAVSDATGRFEVGQLAPGPYLLRAHLPGYVAPRSEMIQVRPSARSTSNIALRREGAPPVLLAGVGAAGIGSASALVQEPSTTVSEPSDDTDRQDDHGATAWRVRHGRRGVLKDATLPETLLADAESPEDGGLAPVGRALGQSARLATSFLSETDFSGQVNLLAASSFDSPQQLFSADGFSRNSANVRVGAPAGSNADWAVAGALTEADISSWVVAGSYSMRAPARHRYDVGMSYSTQQYGGGNPLALRDVTDGSRNVGTLYAFDSFALNPSMTLAMGAEYGRYDYLNERGVVSPRVELTVSPTSNFRVMASASRRGLAPGAEEFLPPPDAGIWLPPQRTFSALDPSAGFKAERALGVEAGVERDIAGTTLALRAFRQQIDDQLVTVFGASRFGQAAANVGHYLVGNAGDMAVSGCSAEFRAVIASRVHGSVEYSMAQARVLRAGDDYVMFLAPVAGGFSQQTIHDLSTRVETEVPETATRLMVVYRVSNGFAQPAGRADGSAVGGRFDVQVRQSLPFMNFSSARWEMLLAVRNFFREAASDQTLFDELLVLRPPKRVVGGVTLHF